MVYSISVVEHTDSPCILSGGTLSDSLLSAISYGFDQLPPDVISYDLSGRQSRFRRFSSYVCQDRQIVRSTSFLHLFNSRRDFHTTFWNFPIKEIQGDLNFHHCMSVLILNMCGENGLDPKEYAIGVNQIRVTAAEGDSGSPAPNLHRDLYNFSCHINISRQNISGGQSLLSHSPLETDIFKTKILNPGEWIFFDDERNYHTATAINIVDTSRPAYRDMFILDFVRLT